MIGCRHGGRSDFPLLTAFIPHRKQERAGNDGAERIRQNGWLSRGKGDTVRLQIESGNR